MPHGIGVLLADMFRAGADTLARRPRRARGGAATHPFRCALCHHTTAHELFPEAVPASFGHHVVRCDGCHLVSTHPPPPVDRLVDFYGDVYYGTENSKFGPLTEVFVLLFRIARLRALRLMGVRRGTVLDIGCGGGQFLRVIERVGYTGWGTELSEAAAAGARRVVGDRVRVGPLVGCAFATGQFDAVTAWQAFEHLHDPEATLRECHRIMRPGGALVLSVPNIESWQARWAGADWFHLDLPRHLFHYSPRTLGAMLAAHGFRPTIVSHYSLEQNPFGLLQSALHRLGAPHFGLYNLLRGPLDRTTRQRWRRLPGYAAYLAAFPLAAAVSSLWSLLRSGATFTVLARRVD
jgi:SAM-dependent methyltransferase